MINDDYRQIDPRVLAGLPFSMLLTTAQRSVLEIYALDDIHDEPGPVALRAALEGTFLLRITSANYTEIRDFFNEQSNALSEGSATERRDSRIFTHLYSALCTP